MLQLTIASYNPSLSNSGERLASLLLVEALLPYRRAWYSFLKYSFSDDCINLYICHFGWTYLSDILLLLHWPTFLNEPLDPTTLNNLFQFENLLKSNLHSWCGTVWHVAESIHILTVFLNFKLLFTANSTVCCDQSVLLPRKNFGPLNHVLQPDNATISIPWL